MNCLLRKKSVQSGVGIYVCMVVMVAWAMASTLIQCRE